MYGEADVKSAMGRCGRWWYRCGGIQTVGAMSDWVRGSRCVEVVDMVMHAEGVWSLMIYGGAVIWSWMGMT